MLKFLQNLFFKNKLPLKAYRLKQDYIINYSGYKYESGRIFIQWWNPKRGYVTQLLATPTSKHRWSGGFSILLNEMKQQNAIEEVSLNELIKIKSHWNIELYQILDKFKINL